MDRVATAIGRQCGTIAACAFEAPALVVLVGPSGAGKSTWAEAAFAAGEIVSSDRLRAVVGEAEDDLAASADAFALLDAIVEARLRRGLTAVVDTLGLDADRRRGVGRARGAARGAGGARSCSRRRPRRAGRGTAPGRGRCRWRCWPTSCGSSGRRARSWPARGSPRCTSWCRRRAGRCRRGGRGGRCGGRGGGAGRAGRLRFGLSLSRFDWPGGAAGMRDGIRRVAGDAEAAGFESVWLMDHVRQIPQVGRAVGGPAGGDDDARLPRRLHVAGCGWARWSRASRTATSRTSAGSWRRSTCCRAAGRCAGSARRGSRRSTARTAGRSRRCAERLDLVADALELLPLLWGPGAPAFDGPRARCAGGRQLSTAAAGARADHRRRPGRAADAPAGGRARRRLQPVRRSRPRCARSSRCCTRTAPRSAATRPRSRSRTSPPASPAPSADAVARLVAGLRPGRRRRRATPRASARARSAEQVGALRGAGGGRRADGDRARRGRRPGAGCAGAVRAGDRRAQLDDDGGQPSAPWATA